MIPRVLLRAGEGRRKNRRSRGGSGDAARAYVFCALLAVLFAGIIAVTAATPYSRPYFSARWTGGDAGPSGGMSIYNKWPDGRPYAVVGYLEADPRERGSVERMADEAQRMGADGLILMDGDGRPSVPVNPGSIRIRAVAVRFTKNKVPSLKSSEVRDKPAVR